VNTKWDESLPMRVPSGQGLLLRIKRGKIIGKQNMNHNEIEKFIRLITKEPFDYTQWQTTLWKDETVEQVSEKASRYRAKQKK